MAAANHIGATKTRAAPSSARAKPAPTPSKRVRVKLDTVDNVRAELARIYREAKAGTREVVDVSRLANVLFIVARLLEGSELEARVNALQQQADQAAQSNNRRGRR